MVLEFGILLSVMHSEIPHGPYMSLQVSFAVFLVIKDETILCYRYLRLTEDITGKMLWHDSINDKCTDDSNWTYLTKDSVTVDLLSRVDHINTYH